MKTILITGASDGIGKLTAIDLAAKYSDATIIIHGRDPVKLDQTVSQIKQTTLNRNIDGYISDFSSLQEVRQFAADVLSKHGRIDILINNAGAGTTPARTGKDGTEIRFTVNYLAPVLLTTQLLPALKKAAPSRVINVSSAGQSFIHFDDIFLEKHFDSSTAYTQSKLALVMYTFDLAEQLKRDNVTVNTLHPGTYLDTTMVREAGVSPLGTAQSGADAIVYLATAEALEGTTGRYFNVRTETKAHAQAYDLAARKRLREITQGLLRD